MKKLKTIAFLARWPGFLVLRELKENPKIDLVAVYTHGLLPKAEGQGQRPELYHFQQEGAYQIPIILIDGPFIGGVVEDFDLIVALSWRHKISEFILERARVAAINIHRGDLPKYPGAEPVRRALEAKENFVAITAHRMTEKIDRGDKIAQVWMKVPEARYGLSIPEHAEVVKEKLYPLYVPLVRLAIEAVA